MDQRTWAAQWRRLAAEQQAADAAASEALPPLPPDAARRSAQQRRAATQLQAQLAKHLVAASTLSAAAATQLSPHSVQQLGRRRQQCEAAAAQLQTACERQLAETQHEEQQLAAEYEAAMQSVQQLLQGAPATSARGGASMAYGHSSGASRRQSTTAAASSASTAPAESGLPPEVSACDAFLQRHGPTGAGVWGGKVTHFGWVCAMHRPRVPAFINTSFCCCSLLAPSPAGGWHSDDHAEFERILTACRGNYAHCVQLAAAELGLLHSQEDVARHARWVHPCGPQWMATQRR